MRGILRNHERSSSCNLITTGSRKTQQSKLGSAVVQATVLSSILKQALSTLPLVLLVGCQGLGLVEHTANPHDSHETFLVDTEPDEDSYVAHKPVLPQPEHRPLSVREQLRTDAIDFWPMVGKDARQIVNTENVLLLGAALGGSLIIRDDLDGRVRRSTAKHPERWGDGSETLGLLGNAEVQVPILLAVHAGSVIDGHDELHDLTTTMLSAYAINGLSTVAIKGIANTDRPSDTWNNGEYGFPSFHASSSVTIAAVLDEYYGPPVALPAYALAGLISWSRIDERDHDLSDVVFGAAMGYVIGKTVAYNHLNDRTQVTVTPSIDPDNGGVQLLVEVPY